MKHLKFLTSNLSSKIAVLLWSVICLQIPLFGNENESEFSSFTMRVCGTLEKDESSTNPIYFIQSENSDIKYVMTGIVQEGDTPSNFYIEGKFLPDSTHCHLKSIKTPDAIPLGEKHCWYTVYDHANQQMILYMDSEDNYGDSNAACEVDRISTKMDMKCGMMSKAMLDADRAKSEKELQANDNAVAGSLIKTADRALTEQEIQNDFDSLSE